MDRNQDREGHSLGLLSVFTMFMEDCLLVNLNMLVSWRKEQEKFGEE